MTERSERVLLDDFDALLCDLDGVVYAGPDAIAGAPDALREAEARGVAVVYVTNNASRPPEAVAEHITQLGAPTSAQRVVGSAHAAANLLRERLEPGTAVLVTGAASLAEAIVEVGLRPVRSQDEQPRAVVQGFDPGLGWQDLAEAAYVLADPEVWWCATNTDRTIPRERGIAPGNGTLVAAVAAAAGREPVVAGKPEAPIFLGAAHRVAAHTPVVVGDRLDTDIRGANAAGFPGALVLTGVDSADTALRAPVADRPRYLLANLTEFFAPYPSARVERAADGSVTAHVREARARADSSTLTVNSTGDDLDGWRAACAAWWAVHDDAAEPTEPRLTWQDAS